MEVGTNTYISLADAETYFDSRLYIDAWIENPEKRETALKWAYILMNQRIEWTTEFDDDNAPDAVKECQCELALYLLQQNPMQVNPGISQIDFDGLRLEQNASPAAIPTKIFKLVHDLGRLKDSYFRLSR